MEKLYNSRMWLIVFASMVFRPSLYAQPFQQPMQVPQLIDAATVNLTMDVEYHNFSGITGDSLNVNIKTFAYNSPQALGTNTYLGPTLRWLEGRHQTINITNNLPGSDTSTVHWHGAHIPAWTDGGPHQKINPQGGTFSPDFEVLDSACTLWYHPHGLDETYVQVQMGLAGTIVVNEASDALGALLPHTYGQDDFPIIIQDIFFQRSTINPDSFSIDTGKVGLGRRVIVNGNIRPYLDVPPQNVRFRILNGSTRLPYPLWIGPNKNQHLPFKLTGSDGGYLPDSARTVTTILTAPGTRNEIVFDFSAYAGQTLYMTTVSGESAQDSLVLQFRVGALPTAPLGIVPATFPAHDVYPYGAFTKTRTKKLLGNSANGPHPGLFNINNLQFVPETINDTINLGDTEVWTIENRTNKPHPFHIHDIQFYVIDVKDTNGVTQPMPVEYLGRKDDIWILPGDVVRFVTKFDDFGSPMPFEVATETYMYHCHILPHEDGMYAASNVHAGMMLQFAVWDGTVRITEAQEIGDGMQLYPNPAHDVLHLRGESRIPSELRIYDIQGRLLHKEALSAFNGDVSIPVADLAVGMILVEWSSAKGTFTKKVVLH